MFKEFLTQVIEKRRLTSPKFIILMMGVNGKIIMT